MTLKTRAAIKAKFGEPLLVDEIELEDPGDEEVLVKLFATGICHSQLHQIHNPDGPVPTLLGHEGTGVVLKADVRSRDFDGLPGADFDGFDLGFGYAF